MTIPAYRLPERIERGSQFGPAFRNVIQEAIAGNEQRYAQWAKCRGVGDLSYGLMVSSDPVGDFAAILAIWQAHRGSLYPFRFRDWSDYVATDEAFGTGDGEQTTFQLTKTYDPSQILLNTPGSLLYVRNIALLAAPPVIKINDVVQTVTEDYTISAIGAVTFVTAPEEDDDLTWSGEFDVPVRFDTDQLPVIVTKADIASIRAIPIREVIGES